jgi:DNA ligase-1
MLAHRYEDHSHKIGWLDPVYSQPKLDGMRCIARADGLWTRKGEPINTVPHIADVIVPLCKKLNLVFDGELYNHDLKDDFNSIMSLVRRQKSSPEHALRVRDIVQYHIYDLVVPNACFNDRWRRLNDVLGYHCDEHEQIVLVETSLCKTQDRLDKEYLSYAADGYEGQMVRVNSTYVHKRTDALLKRKEFQDEEFEIIDILEGKGNRSGMVGSVVLALKKEATLDGGRLGIFKANTFNAALMGTDEFRRRIWKEHQKDSFAGCDATVKYFHKTPDGIPRFPVVKYIDEGK